MIKKILDILLNIIPIFWGDTEISMHSQNIVCRGGGGSHLGTQLGYS